MNQNSELRITHVIESIALGGGAERLVIDICKELKQREGVVLQLLVLYSPSYYGYANANLWEKEIAEYITPVVCDCQIKFNIIGLQKSNVTAFINQIKSFSPHIIHSHLPESELISRTHLFKNVVYFSHLHDNLNIYERKKLFKSVNRSDISNFFIRKWLMSQYKKCNNYFISISNDTLNYLNKNIPPQLLPNIINLPNAIDVERFKKIADTRIKGNMTEIKLVSVGSLVPKKNQVFLIDVVRELKKMGYSVFLKLLGDGSERNIIEEKIKLFGLSENVKLLGYTDAIEEELAWANIYVHAATYEPFGLALIEAMAAGLPVVTLNGKGNKNLIENGKNGYLIEENIPSLFAEKIVTIASNSDLYTSMSENAKKFAKNYDIKNYVDKLLNIYRSALNKQ